MQTLDKFLSLSDEQKRRTILRSDAGFGCDANIDYGLDDGWQFLGKGFSGSRAQNLAAKVAPDAWQDLGNQRWVTKLASHPTYVRPVQYLLLRWLTTQGIEKHAAVICSVSEWSPVEVIAHYDDRGSCETEIQADKGGLKMRKRRKLHLDAQEALILLTDLAHNLLAWSSAWMFPSGPLAKFGTTRLVEDVFKLSGRLIFEDGRLNEIQLNQNHPHADEVAEGLHRLLDHFGL